MGVGVHDSFYVLGKDASQVRFEGLNYKNIKKLKQNKAKVWEKTKLNLSSF